MHRLAILIVAAAAACGSSPEGARVERPRAGPGEPPRAMVERATQEFAAVRDGFFEWYADAYPVRASLLGIHDHAGQLPRMDRRSIQARIDDLLDWSAELDRIPVTLLENEDRYDHAMLEFALRSELLDLEEIRTWVKDPRLYTHPVAAGLASIAEGEYEAVGDRIESLTERMSGAPELLAAARDNLRSPPELWTRLAIADARGLASWLADGLQEALSPEAPDPLPRALVEARDTLARALGDHIRWLETELLPGSTGDYRLGRFLLQRKILYEEHVSLTVDELDRLNQAAIGEYRERLEEAASRIDPSRSVGELLDSIGGVHPPADSLVPAVRDRVRSVRDWVLSSGVVTVPDTALPEVRESPPYARGAFAYLDGPGPFETARAASTLYVTNVRPEWTPGEKAAYLAYFSDPALAGIALHETFPGHYVQAAFEREVDGRLRRLFAPRSLVEGWAHYVEEMALDEGYAADNIGVRLVQLQRALQRHARWHAALRLHATDAPFDEIVREYTEIAQVPEAIARREVIRGTYDPTYLYYALGRMQILELREDYRAHVEEAGETFSLREFHDRLLQLSLPLPLVREELIPTGSRQERGRPR